MNETRGLWRGRCVVNGEWVIGDLVRSITGSSCFVGRYTVVQSTLGECTGLTDKNGKLIFEGDIVRAYYNLDEKVSVGIVCYDKFFDVDSIDTYGYLGWYINVNGNCVSLLQSETDGITIEVIGNIHDNPELISERTN